jgi:hypothetical protein
MNIKSSYSIHDRSNSNTSRSHQKKSHRDAISQRVTDRDQEDVSDNSAREYFKVQTSIDPSSKYLNTASLSSTGEREVNGSIDSQILIQDQENQWDEKREETKIINSVMAKIEPKLKGQSFGTETSSTGIAVFNRN